MPHDPGTAISFFFLPVSVLAVYAPAVVVVALAAWLLTRRHHRLDRRRRRHDRIREDLVTQGRLRRQRLALRAQRRNIGELAGLVRTQLEENKLKLSPYMRQRVAAFIEQAVTTVDFDRLYALYALFSNTRDQPVAPAMELFFEQTR